MIKADSSGINPGREWMILPIKWLLIKLHRKIDILFWVLSRVRLYEDRVYLKQRKENNDVVMWKCLGAELYKVQAAGELGD